MQNQSQQGILSPFLQNKRISMIINILQNIKFKKILDYGCGDANLLKMLKSNIDYTGLDINLKLINQNKKKFPNASFISKLKNQKFDVIVLSAVIEHVINPEKLLQQLKKNLLHKKSIIIITTPNKYFDIVHRLGAFFKFFSKDAADEHNVMFSKKDIYIYANKTSYRVIKFKYFLFYANQIAVLEQSKL